MKYIGAMRHPKDNYSMALALIMFFVSTYSRMGRNSLLFASIVPSFWGQVDGFLTEGRGKARVAGRC